jgi:hypothetical protein
MLSRREGGCLSKLDGSGWRRLFASKDNLIDGVHLSGFGVHASATRGRDVYQAVIYTNIYNIYSWALLCVVIHLFWLHLVGSCLIYNTWCAIFAPVHPNILYFFSMIIIYRFKLITELSVVCPALPTRVKWFSLQFSTPRNWIHIDNLCMIVVFEDFLHFQPFCRGWTVDAAQPQALASA